MLGYHHHQTKPINTSIFVLNVRIVEQVFGLDEKLES